MSEYKELVERLRLGPEILNPTSYEAATRIEELAREVGRRDELITKLLAFVPTLQIDSDWGEAFNKADEFTALRTECLATLTPPAAPARTSTDSAVRSDERGEGE